MDFTKQDYDVLVPSTKNKVLRLLAKIFRRFLNHDIVKLNDSSDMVSLEQVINFYTHLNEIIEQKVKGDVVELGSYTGNCAFYFQSFLKQLNADKTLHLYDSWDKVFSNGKNALEILLKKFKEAGLALPVLHKGYFSETLPHQLPDNIAFAHIDCGFGGHIEEHKQLLLQCLAFIYPRMTPGGVCFMMDYHDPERTIKGINSNPGVKLACDEFLSNKPEKMVVLFGGNFSHGYFRKQT